MSKTTVVTDELVFQFADELSAERIHPSIKAVAAVFADRLGITPSDSTLLKPMRKWRLANSQRQSLRQIAMPARVVEAHEDAVRMIWTAAEQEATKLANALSAQLAQQEQDAALAYDEAMAVVNDLNAQVVERDDRLKVVQRHADNLSLDLDSARVALEEQEKHHNLKRHEWELMEAKLSAQLFEVTKALEEARNRAARLEDALVKNALAGSVEHAS